MSTFNDSFLAMLASGWTVTGTYMFPCEPVPVQRDCFEALNVPEAVRTDAEYSLRGKAAWVSWSIARYLRMFDVDEAALFAYAMAVIKAKVLDGSESEESVEVRVAAAAFESNVFRLNIGHAVYGLGLIDLGIHHLNKGEVFEACEVFMGARVFEMHTIFAALPDASGGGECNHADSLALARKELASRGGKARHQGTADLKRQVIEKWARGEFETKAAAARWACRQQPVNPQVVQRWLPTKKS